MKFKDWLLKGAVAKLLHLYQFVENFENFPEGPRRRYALQASLISRHDKNIILRDESGDVVGIASVWKHPEIVSEESMPEGRYIRIRNMSVKEKGLGKMLFQMIRDYAKSQNAGIYLSSTEGASPFYERQGMHRGLGATYFLTREEI